MVQVSHWKLAEMTGEAKRNTNSSESLHIKIKHTYTVILYPFNQTTVTHTIDNNILTLATGYDAFSVEIEKPFCLMCVTMTPYSVMDLNKPSIIGSPLKLGFTA